MLLEREVPAFVNVANLDQLFARGFATVALLTKIGAVAVPVRIVALLER